MNATEEKAQQINGVGTEASSNRASSGVNESETNPKSGTPVTQRRSGPVRFRLISPSGHSMGTFDTALEAASASSGFWPGIGQDEDRTGAGWDIEVVGS